ncbi:restriction endonuclease subunit S [Faecalibacterium sp. An192]|uniref:restriction endonuclease subunit S n=1 Tax=Faecalibacterium sp. An192 TaxID=1965581 RepID=UPI000B3723B1|nr:restriction endonuclease subunit S [Faecalibacterium sp. An192]OUP28067.1 hypothetical protein B5F27_08150 [Faecalibacterium sp. An192]
MTPQELKNSILQLAIQGKLVEQRPEEGTAQELYAQIQAEKQRLIKEGKIKKEKPLPEITEEEKSFEIPEGWMWVRFGNVVNIVSARRVHQSDWKKEGVPFYRAREIAKLASDGFVDNELFISPELYKEFSKSGVPQSGDLMVSAVGTLGKTYVVKDKDKFYYKDASVICLENYGHILPEYLKYIMSSEMMMRQIRSNSGGTTVATLTMVRMAQYIFPLPPLAEQKRIVAKIEELLPLVDRYEQAWTKLEDFNRRFPEDMKKSILQQAIQGKLVEQRPEEGTAQELYAQIQAEKRRLIKEGKLKKEKPLPEITEDEKPFEIPEGWMWVRLGSIISLVSGTDFKPNEYNDQGRGTVYITGASSLSNTGVIVSRWTEGPKNFAYKGDILLVCKGSGYGKAVFCDVDKAHIARQIMAIRLMNKMDMCYIRFFLQANFHYLKKQGQGVIPGIDRKSVLSMAFPLPPLAEQKRIVEKLEELLVMCERLKE